jgi:L-alanine-DL-glutamate epimerase-like enolase superfamily enzyme
MRIVDIREMAAPIASSIRNAYIDFSKMTVSVVAVVTDQVRAGRRVVGYGFNSNGRYAPTGLLRERFIPRLLEADPASLITDAGDNLDPHKIWQTMMTGEKPGGHGERSVAVGTIDMAVWDAVAKIEGKPLYRLLADRYRGGEADAKVWVYAAGGYYQPGKELSALQDEMRGYREMGYTVVKMKIGGAPLAEDLNRIEAVLEIVGEGKNLAVDANGRFDPQPRSPTPKPSPPTASTGTRKPATPWTTPSRPSWLTITTARWRRAKTSSRCRTPAT